MHAIRIYYIFANIFSRMLYSLLLREKGFGSRFLWGVQVRIFAESLGQRKTIDTFSETHHQVVWTNVSALDGGHGLVSIEDGKMSM
jgi:hypothetical protein